MAGHESTPTLQYGLGVRLSPTADELVTGHFEQTVAVGFDGNWSSSQDPEGRGNNGIVWMFAGGYAR